MGNKDKPMKGQMELPFGDEMDDLTDEQRELLTQLEKLQDPDNPETLKEYLNFFYTPEQKAAYLDIVKNLETLQGKELIRYAMSLKLTSDDDENIAWMRDRKALKEADPYQGPKDWELYGKRHLEHSNRYRREYYLFLIRRLIHSRIPPETLRQKTPSFLISIIEQYEVKFRQALSHRKPR